ncbi:MAG: ferrous iron transport protein A [Candidatus Geothermarchaeales archaeon]
MASSELSLGRAGHMVKTLADLPIGQRGRVLSLNGRVETRRRFLDLGLIPGTEVRAVMESPVGRLRAYMFRSSVFAIRTTEASTIEVESPHHERLEG